ncbi:MAG: histidine ammonia-lyase [Deltaproteobacteria bacterium CG11_big_fil_rev_8_21_14_0_20_47_16]|nr:MAG: histidine ammonia-lyase [Deltaproteobacteria bacterium CG11_big_fil_rev_8_21_14_0_20_47_16]
MEITGENLTVDNVYRVATANAADCQVTLSTSALAKMQTARDYVLKTVAAGKPVYGINTGFGALSDKFIQKNDLEQLQINLIRSHCTGVGDPLDRDTTRALILLRANCLASGFSGINPELVQRLLDFLNHDLLPIIPKQGSVGASGDLAPLAHMSLALIGEGEVTYQGKLMPANDALKAIGKKSLHLGPKDGLALINGTAFMAAFACLAISRTYNLMKAADISAILTLEGVKGSTKAYSPLISKLKPHPGQLDCVANLNQLLSHSEILESHKDCSKVQDPYSLRCVPQVHGACRQTLYHAMDVAATEINSVTDNPLVFVAEDQVLSGGNFHGEALAFCMDYLAMGVSEIANISERRIEKMMNKTFSELPPFLTPESGINSGFMIAQVTAAALVSENKTLCHPASVDSIPTSTDKEDHVSMGPIAGRKLMQVINNTTYCLAIELMCAAQAIEFHRPLKSSAAIEAVMKLIRTHVAPLKDDRVLSPDINALTKLIQSGELVATVEAITGALR